MRKPIRSTTLVLGALLISAMFHALHAQATIIGATDLGPNPEFNITAKADTIYTSDGDNMWMWGYALCANATCPTTATTNRMQYPGPTLIVSQGAVVTINLRNRLPVPVSMVFPGLDVHASTLWQGSSNQGMLTLEVPAAQPGKMIAGVRYRFTAAKPGTYIYYSGTRPDLQVEMGLTGTIIVRPSGFDAANPRAYNDASTAYDREYLFFLSEADPAIHQQVAIASYAGTLDQIQAAIAAIDMSKRYAVDWFMNGRNFPDTTTYPNPSPDNIQVGYPTDLPRAVWLPTQPYNAFPQMRPGEKVLMRIVGAGLDLHPLHTHGQNHLVVARDARVLSTTPNAAAPVADLAYSDYTTASIPGETVDAIWGPWTGEKLGWDVYGTADVNPHTCTPDATGFDPNTREYCADHYKPLPVSLPAESDLTFGPFYGGSPYLGVPAALPPLDPNGNVHVDQDPLGALGFMWHSHNERELTTNDIFIGGMATISLVVPWVCPTGLDCTIW